MFLSTTKRFTIAKNDITCYKVLSIPQSYVIGTNETYVTPFTDTPITKDIWTGKNCFIAEGKFEAIKLTECPLDGLYKIEKGVIHTYCYSFTAKKIACEESVIFECIIPKGTRYIKGGDGWNSCYVSEKIKFLKKI